MTEAYFLAHLIVPGDILALSVLRLPDLALKAHDAADHLQGSLLIKSATMAVRATQINRDLHTIKKYLHNSLKVKD